MSEYADLIDEAIDALRAVLKKTEPGTGLPLHHAFNTLKSTLEIEQKREAAALEPPAPITSGITDAERGITDAERARWSAWKRLERHHRQRLVLETLGDDGLTVAELAKRLESPDMTVHYPDVYTLLTKFMEPAGEVRKVLEPWKSRTRARWYRNTQLEGPIADLQRSLEES